MVVKIAPSILSADFTRLGEQVNEAIAAGAAMIHVDVMDGHFVPNLTIGVPVVAALKTITQPQGIPLDVHLMIENPETLIPDFARAGADILTVHVETCPHLPRTLHQIQELGLKAGVTLNPGTPLESLEEALATADQVLVMSVNPGFGGQAFIPASLGRIRQLRAMLNALGRGEVEIEVDGGIKADNAAEIVAAGADILVIGSGIFNNRGSIAENMRVIRG